MFGFANNLEICTRNISPNVRERILVRSYPIKLSHIFHSILAIILPVIIGALRYEWADINVFRYVIPITFVVSAALTMVFAGRIQERIPQPPIDKKVQIKFWDGMFGVMRNKYKWMNTIVGLLDSLGNGMLPFVTILYLYTFRLSGLLYSLIVALVSFAGTPPDLFAPPVGCPFAARCEHCMQICNELPPEEIHFSAEHSTVCWLQHEMAPETSFRRPHMDAGKEEI